jgi:hypothetical protein
LLYRLRGLLDGQHPIWIGDFGGVGHAQVLFYYQGDHNWWLGDVVGGQLQWALIGNTAGFGGLLDGQHPIWIGDFGPPGAASASGCAPRPRQPTGWRGRAPEPRVGA